MPTRQAHYPMGVSGNGPYTSATDAMIRFRHGCSATVPEVHEQYTTEGRLLRKLAISCSLNHPEDRHSGGLLGSATDPAKGTGGAKQKTCSTHQTQRCSGDDPGLPS